MHIFYTDKHNLHSTDQVMIDGQPFITYEVPQRVEIIRNALLEANLGPLEAPTDHGIEPILHVHPQDYVRYINTVYSESARYYKTETPVFPETFASRNARRKPQTFLGLKGYYGFGTGTLILKDTGKAAYWSVQCALSTADCLPQGETAYALCRSPGHHAGVEFYGGFCYFNNAAISARYLGGKVAILDIDYHHGNGTQEIFYNDSTVLFCSIHAHPDDDYPFYWGENDEKGAGAGLGYNHNYPLPQGMTDSTYLEILEKALDVINDFRPRYLIVSAGFDIVQNDPVGGFNISTEGLHEIGVRIAALNLPTLILQEGGYLLNRLGDNAVAFLQSFFRLDNP